MVKKIPFLSIGIDNAGWRTADHSRDQFKLDKIGLRFSTRDLLKEPVG